MRVLVFLIFGAFLLPPAAGARNSIAYQHYSKGVEFAGGKKWEEALQKFQSAIDLNPGYIASYIEWARTSVMLGKRREALEKLTAALAVAKNKDDRLKVVRERENLSDIFYTNDTFQQYQNGLNYLKLERVGSAVEALERALKTEPDNLLVLAAYGRALQADDRQKDALVVLERAFQLNDGKREIRIDLAEMLLAQSPERTLQLLKPLLAEADERMTWLQATALSARKRNREAIDFLKESIERQPQWVFAPFWLGKHYSLESDGGWNARKYLMTFLKRSESMLEGSKGMPEAELRRLRAARSEAEAILSRVNRSLE
jgi:tetratricopeptide (TPR) repeat protein